MNPGRREIPPELIDLGPDHYTPAEYRDCLFQLGRVGRLLGGDRAGISAFRALPSSPESVLDIGCGGGWFTRRLAEIYPSSQVRGIDFSGDAISLARKFHAASRLDNLSFQQSGPLCFEAPENSVDVVTASLVCHHMTQDELVEFLRAAHRAAKCAVIVNDLHRHWLAYFSFRMIAPILFRNRLISSDGPLSVRKGFIREDWTHVIEAAGISIHRCSIQWKWAFRWVILIDTRS